jgi:[ribosomal protein S5]-alanine N-acetyltransferase
MNILETNRLVLRLLALSDAAGLHRIYSDPETIKFMGKAPDSVEEERNHIQAHIAHHYEKYGVGLWATVLKENNRLIGRCGLERWGKGLATLENPV